MKSKFAKFIDNSLGALLIFAAAFAVMRYYTTFDLAVFSAISITACALLLSSFKSKTAVGKQKLSAAATNMFYDFMFMNEQAPAKLLHAGLIKLEPTAVRRGAGVYLNSTAAFCCFSPPNKQTVARCIAKAKHYGAKKVILLCNAPPQDAVDVDGIKTVYVSGENTYALFASLGALPEHKFLPTKKRRRDILVGVLGKDKILKYLILSAAMFCITVFVSRSVITFVCACVCAVLAAVAIATNIVKLIKN
ncbi:MAG: hypothetical protein HDT28_09335 [Clostridiales bacterium]|nr:hypothetical protein [Clostridiales bacterium]